ncbi:MAG: magnesium transporter CorA family protein [bacterium]|nr:magnesium transporter CorA family protein [bacterium]
MDLLISDFFMAPRIAKLPKLNWTHISPILEEDIGYLEKNYKFHYLDIKDCREGVQRPKMDIYKHYIFAIFHFPIYNKKKKRVNIKSLNVFVGKDFLITLSPEKDRFLESLSLRARQKTSKQLSSDITDNGAAFLLYKILDVLYRKYLPLINKIGNQISHIEDEVYSGKNKIANLDLAISRRNIINLRRILEPQLKIMSKLVHMDNKVISSSLSIYFDDIDDYIENMWAALGNHRESVDGLYDTNESFINQRTNEVIKVLTIISVALLPLTLIASIYGMNVVGLPFADHPTGLWIIFFLMGGMVAGSIYFAKKNNMI